MPELSRPAFRVAILEPRVPGQHGEIQAALDSVQVDTVAALNSDDVLFRLHRERVDMVVIDAGLTDQLPVTLVRDIRSRVKSTRFLPILMAVDIMDTELRREAIDAGVQDFVLKPLDELIVSNRVMAYLESKRYHDQLAEAQAELEVERGRLADVHRRLVAPGTVEGVGWSVATGYLSGNAGAPDYYDLFVLGDGRVAVAMADLPGDGHYATFFLALTRGILRTALLAGRGIHAAMIELNDAVMAHREDIDLMMVYVAVINPAAGTVEHLSAGHPDPMLLHAGEIAAVPAPGSPPLGTEPVFEAQPQSFTIAKGDRLVMCCNSIWKAMGEDGPGPEFAALASGELAQVPEMILGLASSADPDHSDNLSIMVVEVG